MKRLPISIIIFIAMCSAASADNSTGRTVQWLHDGWVQSQNMARGNSGDKQGAFLAGQYVGYVIAESDLIRDGLIPEIAIPPKITYDEILAVVGDYLDAHSQENGSAAEIVVKACLVVWPAKD